MAFPAALASGDSSPSPHPTTKPARPKTKRYPNVRTNRASRIDLSLPGAHLDGTPPRTRLHLITVESIPTHPWPRDVNHAPIHSCASGTVPGWHGNEKKLAEPKHNSTRLLRARRFLCNLSRYCSARCRTSSRRRDPTVVAPDRQAVCLGDNRRFAPVLLSLFIAFSIEKI